MRHPERLGNFAFIVITQFVQTNWCSQTQKNTVCIVMNWWLFTQPELGQCKICHVQGFKFFIANTKCSLTIVVCLFQRKWDFAAPILQKNSDDDMQWIGANCNWWWNHFSLEILMTPKEIWNCAEFVWFKTVRAMHKFWSKFWSHSLFSMWARCINRAHSVTISEIHHIAGFVDI